jgi:hypothetical protein
MNTASVVRAWVYVLAAHVFCASALCAPITVEATVHVGGTPKQGVGVIARTSEGDAVAAITDAEGEATIVFTPPPADRVVTAVLSYGNHAIFTNEQRAVMNWSPATWLEGNCVMFQQHILLVPGTAQFSVAFDAVPCARIRGRVVTVDGIAQEALAVVAGCSKAINSVGLEFVAVAPTGSAARLFVATNDAVHVVPLTPQQTTGDVVLPDIVQIPDVATGSCRVAVTPAGWTAFFDQSGGDVSADTTLIRTDGARVADGEVLSQILPSGERAPVALIDRVPPGEYFLIAGSSYTPDALALLDAISRGDDLSQSGIPRVTIVANQTIEATLDMPAVHKILFNMRRP